MAEDKRNFLGSICVRFNTKRHKLELASAKNFGGEPGLYRVRIDRRWRDGPDGSRLYLDRAGLAELVASLMDDANQGEAPALEPLPDLPLHSRVYARYEYRDEWQATVTYTSSPPIRGQDGQIYVGINFFGGVGYRFLPLKDLTVIQTPAQLRRFKEDLARKEAEFEISLDG
jgi:hypothetical protein